MNKHIDDRAPAVTMHSQGDDVIDKALAYMRLHFHEPISRDGVAETVHMSPSYFSTVFKQKTGRSFCDYLLALRMERAIKLLETRLPIKEIARRCGYQNSNSFSRNFQAVFGCAPSEYRKQLTVKG